VKILLLSVGFAVLCVLQVFVQIVRDRVWSKGQDLSTDQVIEIFMDSTDLETLFGAVNRTANRVNLTNTHAWTMVIADNVGFLPEQIFGGLASIYVPRIIWPEKPEYRPGFEHTKRVFGAKKRLQTSTASGFVTELYLGGGLIAAILGSVCFGF